MSQLLFSSIMMQNIQIFYRGPVVFFVTCLCHAYLLAVALCSHCKTEFESNDDINSSFFQGDFKTWKKKKKKLYGHFLWMGVNCLKATKSRWWGSLLFTITFLEISGAHLIDLGRMRGWNELGATQWFWRRDPRIGNPAP